MKTKYKRLDEYIEDVYYDLLFSKIKSFILNNKNRINLRTTLVPSPTYLSVEDFNIVQTVFHEIDQKNIELKMVACVNVELSGMNNRCYENDSKNIKIDVISRATLSDGLKNFQVVNLEEHIEEKFNKTKSLSKYLIPYIYSENLEKNAEAFLEKYCPEALETPMPLPIDEVLKNMGLKFHYSPLEDNIFGRMYFQDSVEEVYDSQRKIYKTQITKGTILVNPNVSFMRNIGSENNTIIHECVHWEKHAKFFELQKLLNPNLKCVSCESVEKINKHDEGMESELAWMEWQANALAPKILIPEKMGRKKLQDIINQLNKSRIELRNAEIMKLAIEDFADFFHVSVLAGKIRAIELGFDTAIGVFNYVDGILQPPFSFKKGSLEKHQTFHISAENFIVESIFNANLKKALENQKFIHVGGLVVINHPKYVVKAFGQGSKLTNYALDHVDECCLIFSKKTQVNQTYDDTFYRECFLCRDVDSKNFVDAVYDPKAHKNDDRINDAIEMKKISDETIRVSKIFDEMPSSFSGTLKYHKQRRNYTNEKLEELTGISADTIGDYCNKNNENPTVYSVLALCIGLNLQSMFSYDLLEKAGYDIIHKRTPENLLFCYLIENHADENIHMWNEKIKAFGIKQQLPRNINKKI